MARREADVTITAPGRDVGKVFHVMEMPAVQAEKWAARAFFAVGRSGLDVPEGLLSAGGEGMSRFAGLMAFAGQALMTCSFADAEPLMDEMMRCVTAVPNPKTPEIRVALDVAEYIEEVPTLWTLRREVLDLHLGFSTAAEFSKFRQAMAAAASNTQNTLTSPDQLAA